VTADEKIIELLTKLLKVSALQAASGFSSVTEAARALKAAGLDNKTIGQILHTSPAVIATLTTKLGVRVKKKGRRK
jgi:hypothetical protein